MNDSSSGRFSNANPAVSRLRQSVNKLEKVKKSLFFPWSNTIAGDLGGLDILQSKDTVKNSPLILTANKPGKSCF